MTKPTTLDKYRNDGRFRDLVRAHLRLMRCRRKYDPGTAKTAQEWKAAEGLAAEMVAGRVKA